MDRYDAILEHLENAQSKGRESVMNRLDTVVSSLEQLMETAKETIQAAVPSTEEEVLPLAEVEAMIADLRAQPTVSGGVSLDHLRVLDEARSQSELLRALLPMLAESVGRAVVLVIRDGVVTAWSGTGFDNEEKLRSWHGGLAGSPDLAHLHETTHPQHFSPATDPLFSEWLAGETMPEEAVLLPISLRGKLMGVIYIDHIGGQPWDVDTAQALNAVACWLIDTLHHRASVPSPMLAEIAEQAAPAVTEESSMRENFELVEEPEPAAAPAAIDFDSDPTPSPAETGSVAPELEIADEFDQEPSAIDFGHPPTEAAPEPQPEPPHAPVPAPEELEPAAAEEAVSLDYDFEASSAAEPVTEAGFDPSATIRVDATEELPQVDFGADSEPGPASEPSVEAALPAVETPLPEVDDAPPTPPPVQPIEPPTAAEEEIPQIDFGRTPEDDAKLEEARRFARLLVSEIKLYNEDEVEKGRAAKDIGKRLREDIERSREMYEKRISPQIRQEHDYFRDELIRILADGDAEALDG
jgi:hypothetical protein